MADITMCEGKGCTVKDKCYRHTAKACEYYQSYFLDPPGKDDKCKYFWKEKRQKVEWNSAKTWNMKLTEDDLLNKWLGDYHNTSLEQVIKEHPEWEEEPQKHTRTFYEMYAVTQKQHDEWNEWMIRALAKDFKTSLKYMRGHSWAIYLNTAPNIRQ